MALRFEEADKETVDLMEALRAKLFPWAKKAQIKLLFDTKKRKKSGMLVMGSITRPGELLRYFSRQDAKTIQGYDYVITLDKMAWCGIEKADKIRILRHELRHICIDDDKPDPYMLQPHDVNDFEVEIGLNQDDPDWGKRVATITAAGYKNEANGLHPYQGAVPGAGKPEEKPVTKKRYTLDKQKTMSTEAGQ